MLLCYSTSPFLVPLYSCEDLHFYHSTLRSFIHHYLKNHEYREGNIGYLGDRTLWTGVRKLCSLQNEVLDTARREAL